MLNTPNLDPVKSYFGKRIEEFGASPRGVDWNSEASQNVRFDQLLRVIEATGNFPSLIMDVAMARWQTTLLKKISMLITTATTSLSP